jgi:hypothetical protein
MFSRKMQKSGVLAIKTSMSHSIDPGKGQAPCDRLEPGCDGSSAIDSPLLARKPVPLKLANWEAPALIPAAVRY